MRLRDFKIFKYFFQHLIIKRYDCSFQWNNILKVNMKKSPVKCSKINSHNIVDMFRKQQQSVRCPACEIQVHQSKLNFHLDKECSSSPTKTTKSPEDQVKSTEEAAQSIKVGNDSISLNSSGCDNQAIKNLTKKPVLSLKRKKKVDAIHSNSDVNFTKTSSPNIESSTANFDSVVPEPSFLPPRTEYTTYKNVEELFAKNARKKLNLSQASTQSIDSVLSDVSTTFNNSETEEDTYSESQGTTSQDSESKQQYSPYYISNFKYIINKVLSDDYNKHLFNEIDSQYVQSFHALSDKAQRLYVRLFQRKYKWLRPNNMNYPELSDNLMCILEELLRKQFLESGANHIELEAALNLLSLSEVKNLSKLFNLNASSKSKAEISQLLINHGKQHKSFFFGGGNSITSAILKKVRQCLGPCFRLTLEPKRLFTRILMLFSLPTISEDDEEAAGGQQQQLLTLLQVNKGELVFPEYKLSREFQIFENRDSLIRYTNARQMENDILNAIETKKFELAKNLYLNAKNEYKQLLKSEVAERDKAMPFYLRRYSACHVYTRCLNQGVEVFQKLRLYEDAVNQLEELLEQTVYCQDRRGRWWDRLALNLDQHLKEREKAVDCIKKALQDPYVRVGPRHALFLRGEKLKKGKLTEENPDEMSDLIKAPTVTIKGRLLPQSIPNRKHVFISTSSYEASPENNVTVLGVEQLAIEHYKSEGYPEGIHGEGSTFISLYALLFWDIIYDGDIPDAFISPYQTHPLDLNSDDYFIRRKSQISSHLEYLRSITNEELCNIVKSSWTSHYGKASLVSWDRFTDVDHIQGLVSCFGNLILASICERISKDFRFTRSGVPDLVVWNPDTKVVKVVEVKGPGDKLSSKQILWLDYLIRIGADCEVCLVEAVGSKRLRRE